MRKYFTLGFMLFINLVCAVIVYKYMVFDALILLVCTPLFGMFTLIKDSEKLDRENVSLYRENKRLKRKIKELENTLDIYREL